MKRLRLILAAILIVLVAGFFAYPRLIYPKTADAAVPQNAGQTGSGQHAGKGAATGGHSGSPTAVVTWRVSCDRRSPAANNPGMDVCMMVSVFTYPISS